MIKRRPQAISAMIEAAEYLGHDDPALADRFLDAAEASIAKLGTMPGMGHPYLSEDVRLRGIRVGRVKGFQKWLIFYRPLVEGIEILHVLHGARDVHSTLLRELFEPEVD